MEYNYRLLFLYKTFTKKAEKKEKVSDAEVVEEAPKPKRGRKPKKVEEAPEA